MSKLGILAAGAVCVVGAYLILEYQERPSGLTTATRPPKTEVRDLVALEEPKQGATEGASQFGFGEYTVSRLATFEITARVLSRRRYRFTRLAKLSPVDLALGWGRMSEDRILEHIRVSQGNRWYYWRARSLPIPATEIQTHSANMHIIPADETVAQAALKARKGDIVSFRGYLVGVTAPDGFRWYSSTTRTDKGARSCEVVWVESFEVLQRGR